MTEIDYEFTVTVKIDGEKLEMLHGERWVESLKESSAEFSTDLYKFLDNHCFIQACRLKETVKIDDESSRPINKT